LLIRSSLNKDANAMLSIQSVREKFKIKVFIKSKEKIKRIIITTTNNIINRAREIDAKATLLARKNIIVFKDDSISLYLKLK